MDNMIYHKVNNLIAFIVLVRSENINVTTTHIEYLIEKFKQVIFDYNDDDIIKRYIIYVFNFNGETHSSNEIEHTNNMLIIFDSYFGTEKAKDIPDNEFLTGYHDAIKTRIREMNSERYETIKDIVCHYNIHNLNLEIN